MTKPTLNSRIYIKVNDTVQRSEIEEIVTRLGGNIITDYVALQGHTIIYTLRVPLAYDDVRRAFESLQGFVDSGNFTGKFTSTDPMYCSCHGTPKPTVKDE